jgi:hypothetical protein
MEKNKKRYTFTRTVTIRYTFEVDAYDREKATEEFADMRNSDAVGKQVIDNESNFVGAELIHDEEDEL